MFISLTFLLKTLNITIWLSRCIENRNNLCLHSRSW